MYKDAKEKKRNIQCIRLFYILKMIKQQFRKVYLYMALALRLNVFFSIMKGLHFVCCSVNVDKFIELDSLPF